MVHEVEVLVPPGLAICASMCIPGQVAEAIARNSSEQEPQLLEAEYSRYGFDKPGRA